MLFQITYLKRGLAGMQQNHTDRLLQVSLTSVTEHKKTNERTYYALLVPTRPIFFFSCPDLPDPMFVIACLSVKNRIGLKTHNLVLNPRAHTGQ